MVSIRQLLLQDIKKKVVSIIYQDISHQRYFNHKQNKKEFPSLNRIWKLFFLFAIRMRIDAILWILGLLFLKDGSYHILDIMLHLIEVSVQR